MMKTAYSQGQQAAFARYAGHSSGSVKHADIAKLLRLLATPVEDAPLLGRALRSVGVNKTPTAFMASRGPAALDAIENGVRKFQQTHVHQRAYNALKKMKVDKAFQALEPYTGSTAEPSIRAQYGDRHIWTMAHAPVQTFAGPFIHGMAGQLPIVGGLAQKGILNAYTTGRAAYEKLLGVPGPLSYGQLPGSNPVNTVPAAAAPVAPPVVAPAVAPPAAVATPTQPRFLV